MSEYQYYEFQAIDRPLSERDMAELRKITARAEITPSSLINEYHWGDFKGNPDRLMDEYFDAFLYFANWGSRRLMFRLPRPLFDPTAAHPYCVEDAFGARATKNHIVLDFHSDTEGDGDYEEGEGWLASLSPLRADLMAGDLRCLYLAWLAWMQWGDEKDDAPEPPVPPGLQDLTGALERLADFLRLDADLIEAAAGASSGKAPAGPSTRRITGWVTALPEAEKNAILRRVVEGEGALLKNELLRRFMQEEAQARLSTNPEPASETSGRTVGDLLKARDDLAEKRRRREAEETARERRARELAAARARHLDSLVGKEASMWQAVEAAIATRLPKGYDRAVALVRDLYDLGERSGEPETVRDKIRELRRQHGAKRTLIQRLDKAGLSP
jgi:hypothetical protein